MKPLTRQERVHSPSSISLAKQCRHAWALCYIDKIRKPEVTWEQCLAHDAWKAAEPPPFPMRARGAWLEAEPFKPEGGQRGAALGGRVHLYAQWHMCGADKADANAYGPRRWIDWESLPGQVLQAMLPHLPQAGSVDRSCVEVDQRVTVDGVLFRCISDILHDGVWDHKTSKDVRDYALFSHAVAVEAGVPERSLRDDLQACINALAYGTRPVRECGEDTLEPITDAVACHWTYTETGKIRRALPVVQEIPVAHALGVVRKAAALAKTLTYETSADAPADTLRCDDYGGCWYRRAGHCTKPRRWGGVIRQLELKQEKRMALTWKELQAKQAAANGNAAPAAKAPAPVAAKPAAAPKAATPAPAKAATPKPAAVKAAPKPKAPPPPPVEAEDETTEPAEEPAEETPVDGVNAEGEVALDFEVLGRLLAQGAGALSEAMKLVREAKAKL
jgi:hypothetical protein